MLSEQFRQLLFCSVRPAGPRYYTETAGAVYTRAIGILEMYTERDWAVTLVLLAYALQKSSNEMINYMYGALADCVTLDVNIQRPQKLELVAKTNSESVYNICMIQVS